MKRFGSFGELYRHLSERPGETFLHHWQNPSYQNSLPFPFARWVKRNFPALDFPGRSGTAEVPRFLYRGEAGVFRNTLPSSGRVIASGKFSNAELSLLSELAKLSTEVHIQRLENFDPLRAECWAQHYGIPTPSIDLTSDPGVALHFAAEGHEPPPGDCIVYRIDLRAVERKVYGREGRPTPLSAASLQGTYFTRAVRQKAWFIRSNRRDSHRFDLQRSWHLWRHVERFRVAPRDREEFYRPDLLSAEDDAHASWPLAFVRALKFVAGGGLSETLARFLCNRIPLFEWTPVLVQFDDYGREMNRVQVSPAEAKRETGRDYGADKEAVITELMSARVDRPHCLLFGVLRGGLPGERVWYQSGDRCQILWLTQIKGPQRSIQGYNLDLAVVR